MKCSEIKEFLSAYANDELSPLQKGIVEEHLSGCVDCRATLADYRVIRQQLESLKTVLHMPETTDAMTFQIKSLSYIKLASKWLCPALVALPIIVAMIILLVIQPWNPVSGPQAVIAKAITATDGLITYRVSCNPFISFSFPDGREIQSEGEWEFVLPSRSHIKFTLEGRVSEYIWIGNTVYYLRENSVILFADPYSFPLFDPPNKENILQELESIANLEQLIDENIDGVDCLHFKWIDSERANSTIELWLGKGDYLIRQRISRTTMPNGKISVSIKKYYDFNQTISIKAPVTSSGALLDGWIVMDTASMSGNIQAPTETGTTMTTSLPHTTTKSP